MQKKRDLIIQASGEETLSSAQKEFNRLMKSLESVRSKHAKEQAKLNAHLVIAAAELMPLVEELNRTNRDMIFSSHRAMDLIKFSAKRRYWLSDLVAHKASALIHDPAGLSDEDVAKLEKIVALLTPEDEQEEDNGEFDLLRKKLEEIARLSGVDLDLSGLDPSGDPEEFERLLRERLDQANPARRTTKKRKPTKAQQEKEKRQREQEEAKNKDIKSLFKQLAKAFHPDLESDPILKAHKEIWMQRLNAAYSTGDLREMLQLEMEWLGEEATNLKNASDEKLKVYCAVLKEQISQLKSQTIGLIHEPQYHLLRRFIHPFFQKIPPVSQIKLHYQAKIEQHREMLDILNANNMHTKKMLNQWADTNDENSQDFF